MAQLNTTVGNIQLKENMIITGDNKAWTDDYYPSAKSVSNIVDTKIAAIIPSDKFEHPVGSVLITSTNYQETDAHHPNNAIGGEWSLIDKEYKNDYRATYNFSGWTPAATNGATLELSSRGGFIWNGHSLFIQIVLVTPSTVELNSGAVLGTISRPSCGIKENGTFYLCPENGIALVSAGDSNYMISYEFYYDGTITFKRIVSSSGTARTTLPKGAKIYIDVPIQVFTTDMLDDFCDKFYWKRTK